MVLTDAYKNSFGTTSSEFCCTSGSNPVVWKAEDGRTVGGAVPGAKVVVGVSGIIVTPGAEEGVEADATIVATTGRLFFLFFFYYNTDYLGCVALWVFDPCANPSHSDTHSELS